MKLNLLILALFLTVLLFIQADALRRPNGPMPGGHNPISAGSEAEREAIEYFNMQVTPAFYDHLTKNKLMGDKDPFQMNTKPMIISVTSQVVAGTRFTYRVKYDNAEWKISVVRPLPVYDPQQTPSELKVEKI